MLGHHEDAAVVDDDDDAEKDHADVEPPVEGARAGVQVRRLSKHYGRLLSMTSN